MTTRRARRPRPLREYVLTGLSAYPAADSVANMAGYDQCPPALRQRIANNPHPMVFANTPDGATLLLEIH